MISIDIRTLFLEQTISFFLYLLVIAVLWLQYHRRFSGLSFWLANFTLQALGAVLMLLRGAMPPWVSIIFSNAFFLGGVILLYVGLEFFFDERSRQYHNVLFFLGSVAIHVYFTFVSPNLAARNINISAGLLLLSLQIAWLMLWRVDEKIRHLSMVTGYLFLAFALICIIRITLQIINPVGDDFFTETATFDAILLFTYQILFFAVTFSLFRLINGRLAIQAQHQQEALQKSEARYRDLVNFSPDALYVYQNENLVFFNTAAMELVRAKRPEDLMGKNALSFVHPDLREKSRERIAKVAEEGGTAPLLETKLVRLDGSVVDVDLTTTQIEFQDAPALHTIARDITARKRAQDVLHLRLKMIEFAAEHTLNELMTYALDEICEITQSPIGFYHFVEEDQVTLSLQAWSTRTLEEFCQAEGHGMHYGIDKAGVWVDCVRERKPVIHNDYAALPHRKGLPPGHAPVQRELVVPTMRKEKIVSVLGVGNKTSDYDEQDIDLVSYVADVIWDIVARKRIETKLEAYRKQLEDQNTELRKFRLAIEQSGNAVIIANKDGEIEYVNNRFEETSGYTLKELQGKHLHVLNSGMQEDDFFTEMWRDVRKGKIWQREFQNRRKDDSLYWEAVSMAPVQDASGEITHFIEVKQDISGRKALEEQLRRLATIDSLTGVYNRRQISMIANRELKRSHRYAHSMALVMLDLDYLKQINDNYGHGIGDIAIRKTAQVIKDNLRSSDSLGRYGGDEFVIVLPETSNEQAAELAERLRVSVAELVLPVGDADFRLSISLGVACVQPRQDDRVPDFGAVASLADEMLYAAKAAGRNCVRVK